MNGRPRTITDRLGELTEEARERYRAGRMAGETELVALRRAAEQHKKDTGAYPWINREHPGRTEGRL